MNAPFFQEKGLKSFSKMYYPELKKCISATSTSEKTWHSFNITPVIPYLPLLITDIISINLKGLEITVMPNDLHTLYACS